VASSQEPPPTALLVDPRPNQSLEALANVVGGSVEQDAEVVVPAALHGEPDGSLAGAPGGIRTPDHLIRSQTLCPLSYGRAAGR
jgi:hypothetical protein